MEGTHLETESWWQLHQDWNYQIKQTSISYVRRSRTSTFPKKSASFIFQPCIFNSCSHLGKTGHFMDLIPGIHQHSVRQHGSQIFLCQKYVGQKRCCKEIGHTDDQLCLRHDEPKQHHSSKGKNKSYYVIVQMLWSCWFHLQKLYIQRRNNQPVIPKPPYMQSSV